MSQISKILRQAQGGILLFWCPGCEGPHQVRITGEGRPRWGYNGNADRPTFTPSLLVTGGHYVAGKPQPPDCAYCKMAVEDGEPGYLCTRCHSFITDGSIQFLSDCTHKLAGRTVPIPEWPRPDWCGVELVEIPS